MPPSGVDYASEFLNGYAPEYVPCPQPVPEAFVDNLSRGESLCHDH